MCDYTLESLQKYIFIALESVLNFTILGDYKSYLQKIELYRKSINYSDAAWKMLISHQKVYVSGDNC